MHLKSVIGVVPPLIGSVVPNAAPSAAVIYNSFTGNVVAAGDEVSPFQSVAVGFAAPFTGLVTTVTVWMGAGVGLTAPVVLGIEPDLLGKPSGVFLNNTIAALNADIVVDGTGVVVPTVLDGLDWPIVGGQDYWLAAIEPFGGFFIAWVGGEAGGRVAIGMGVNTNWTTFNVSAGVPQTVIQGQEVTSSAPEPASIMLLLAALLCALLMNGLGTTSRRRIDGIAARSRWLAGVTALGLDCVKTQAFNLCVESPSRFCPSKEEWRCGRDPKKNNRENNSPTCRPLSVFTQPRSRAADRLCTR
jgi:hypothetical protein